MISKYEFKQIEKIFKTYMCLIMIVLVPLGVSAALNDEKPISPIEMEFKPAPKATVADIEVVEPEIDILPATDAEIDLLTLVTMAEAEGESVEGKRLVIDTILNRVDHSRFPNTIHDVVYQPSQFTSMWNGRIDRCYVRNDIRQLVIEELKNRTNRDVIFFRTDYYCPYGTPLFQVGNHYFSKY